MRVAVKNIVFTLLAVTAGIGAVWFGAERGSETTQASQVKTDRPASDTTALVPPLKSEVPYRGPENTIETTSRHEALIALEEARRIRAAAEAELERLDLELESMAAFDPSIETEAEDPVLHAEETMARLESILTEYLDAEERLLAAEEIEIATAALVEQQ